MKKPHKRRMEEKAKMQKTSKLNENNRPFKFIDKNDLTEYWDYLCTYDKDIDESDGMLFFLRDTMREIVKKRDHWSEDLEKVINELYEVILTVIDRMEKLKDEYQGNLTDIENIMYALNEAVAYIPISKKFDEKIAANNPNDAGIDEEVKDKILRYVRDHIISKNMTAR